MTKKNNNDFYSNVLERFWDQYALNCKLSFSVVSGQVKHIKKEDLPILMDLCKIESSQEFFFSIKMNGKPEALRCSPIGGNSIILTDEASAKSNYFFWIDEIKQENIEVKYLKRGVLRSGSDIEFAFGDNVTKYFIQNEFGSKDIPRTMQEWFTFKANDGFYMLMKTYQRDSKNINILGTKSMLDVYYEDGKYVSQSIKRKPLPNNYDDFLELTILRYDNVSFVEKSQAKRAMELISEEDRSGESLMMLWKKYSEIELQRAENFQKKLGDIKFFNAQQRKDSVVRVTLQLNEDQKIIFNSEMEQLEKETFSFLDTNGTPQKDSRLTIKSYNRNLGYIDLYDDDYRTLKQGDKGFLRISIRGNEVMYARRDKALSKLKAQNLLLRNVRMAMEGHAADMVDFSKRKSEKPLSERTRKFIKDTFNIDDLTQDQKDAVEIAINTPDIAIIQGPPGTGKSTVISVIAERLMELAEKGNGKSPNDKVILVSAFQNDTVEHIASKIQSFGIPSSKIGKDTNGINAVDNLSKRLKDKIYQELPKLSPNNNLARASKKLADLQSLYLKENKLEDIDTNVLDVLMNTDQDNTLIQEWREITKFGNEATTDKDMLIKALKGLRTDKVTYEDDGFKSILKLQRIKGLELDSSEKDLLESAPVESPTDEFLEKLLSLKNKYLDLYLSQTNSISGSTNINVSYWFDKAIKYYQNKEMTDYEDEDTFLVSTLENILNDLDGSSLLIKKSIREYTQSIAATNQVAGGRLVGDASFENVILEEAARANPLDLIIPMTRANKRIILVGDQQQLPHLLEHSIAEETVAELQNSSEQETENSAKTKNNLELSLFGILYNNLAKSKPVRRIQLTNQFRMHPVIGDFISKIFYHGTLSSKLVDPSKKEHRLSLPWAQNKIMIWYDVPKSKGVEMSKGSKSRKAEAERIADLIDEITHDQASRELSIGVITFYSWQQQLIYEECTKRGFAKTTDDGFEIAPEYRATRDNREKLRIGSVDSFQGKEFDIVILSVVRCNNFDRNDKNSTKVFGFLSLENRLNVAFSRAQKMIITVGDSEMFSDDYAKTYVEGLYEFYQLTDSEYGTRI